MIPLRIAYARLVVSVAAAALLACASAPQGSGSSSNGGKRRNRGMHKSESAGETNTRLAAELEQLRRDYEILAQSNAILQDELAWAHEDFKLVENQFVAFEEQMASNYGKAAAVSATAEARIRYDRMTRNRLFSSADTTAAHVLNLIDTSERLIRDQNYTAALFFAERADHMMSGAERRSRLGVLPTNLTVVVDTANLRSGPGQGHDVVERLTRDAPLLCLDHAGEWYRVRSSAGAEGWVHASLVR